MYTGIWPYVLGILVLVIVFLLSLTRRKQIKEPLPLLQSTKPKCYVFMDTEVNSRNWWDFGGRNSNQSNRGYLQLTLESLQRTQGRDFEIIPLLGRDAVYSVLPAASQTAKQLPPALWRSWVISNICSTRGGLVIDGNSTLCVGPSFGPVVKPHTAVIFGIYPAEPIANSSTAVAPGAAPYVGWAAQPNHPAWMIAANTWNELVERGPQSWSAASARRADMEVFEKQVEKGIKVIRDADGSRTVNGKQKQLEDYFGRVANPSDPRLELHPGAVYVAYDGDNLERRHEFNWFLRMSPEQIKESDLVWAKLAGA